MINQNTISRFNGKLQRYADALESKVELMRLERKRQFPNPWRVMQAEKEIREQLDKMMSLTSDLWREIYATEPKDYRNEFKEE